MTKFSSKQLPSMGGHSQFARKLDYGLEIAQVGSVAKPTHRDTVFGWSDSSAYVWTYIKSCVPKFSSK